VKQAPAWNAVTQLFKGHPDVAFGDVSLSKSRVSEIHGVAQNPGAGGWPTIRIFNNKTGYGGKAYDKKTSEAMCDELGPNNEYMRKLVEEYAPLNCNIDDTIGCSKKAKKFIEKWADEPLEGIQKQLLYLETASEPKKKSAKEWQQQRVDIFKQYARRHGAEL